MSRTPGASEPVLARSLALWILILLIGTSAFAYGSVDLWSAEWLRFGAILAVGVLAWSASPRKLVEGPAGAFALPTAMFILWGFLQTLPLPGAVIRTLSPKTARLYAETVPPAGGGSLPAWLLEKAKTEDIRLGADTALFAVDPVGGDFAVGRSISIYPYLTRRTCLAWLTSFLVFLASARVARDEMARYRLLWAVAAWAGVWGLVGVLQKAGWDGQPFWTRQPPAQARPALPFVNPNHLAGFVELGALVGLGLALAILSRRTGRLDRGSIRSALVDKVWALPRLLGVGLLLALSTTGLALSRSAGGYLAFVCGLVFLASGRRLRAWLLLPAAGIALLGVAVGIVGLVAPAREGLESSAYVSSQSDPSALTRLDAWAKSLRMFLDYPITGTGLGTFQWGFASYQREGEWMRWKTAHNDYLQMLSETGLVGALLLVWALGVFLVCMLAPAVRGVSGQPRWTTIGVAAAIFAMMVHSIVDFNLQVPANAALFAVLLGTLAAAARDDEGRRSEEQG